MKMMTDWLPKKIDCFVVILFPVIFRLGNVMVSNKATPRPRVTFKVLVFKSVKSRGFGNERVIPRAPSEMKINENKNSKQK